MFDGLIFDVDYFREKMAESRQRKRELRERVRQMLAGSRSGLADVSVADLSGAADLMEALTSQPATQTWAPERERFDLARYQSHIQANLRPFPITLAEIPPLSENTRKDKIWRFIALIFLAHAGIIDIWQNGQEIMVKQSEIDTERQDISGDIEAVDGIQGTVC